MMEGIGREESWGVEEGGGDEFGGWGIENGRFLRGVLTGIWILRNRDN